MSASRAACRRAEAQSGGTKMSNHLTTGGRHSTQPNHLVDVLLGNVVVITMEPPTRDAGCCGEGVQLLEARVTHEVSPPPVAVLPLRLVDPDRHGREPHTRGRGLSSRSLRHLSGSGSRSSADCLAYARDVSAPEVDLRRVWHGVAGRQHDATIEFLLELLREPHRRYHTATHVMWVCRHVTELSRRHPVDDIDALLVAALFHDAVYDPRSSSNEADSARLAVRLTMGLPGWTDNRGRLVERLIQATSHSPASASITTESPVDDTFEGGVAVLLDADLAVLGADPASYEAYRRAVRSEYDHLDDAAWQSGRSAVLTALLDRPYIYSTATMRESHESQARANLTAELATLRSASH